MRDLTKGGMVGGYAAVKPGVGGLEALKGERPVIDDGAGGKIRGTVEQPSLDHTLGHFTPQYHRRVDCHLAALRGHRES